MTIILFIVVLFIFSCEGVSEKAGAQTGPGLLSVETSATPHQIPAVAEGQSESDGTS